MEWSAVSAELAKKLDPKHVQAPKQFGPKGSYLEGWFVIQEANRIFGFDGWSYSIKDCKCVSERPRKIGKAPNEKDGWGVTYTVAVYVDVCGGVRREDVGAGHGYDVDCGLAHESAIKEAVTDALKRALRTFGNPFGLALYDKSRENVGVDLPPFDAQGCCQRLIDAANRRKTKQELRALWESETDARVDLKAANPALYGKFVEAFTAAGAKAIGDPAMQSPERDAA